MINNQRRLDSTLLFTHIIAYPFFILINILTIFNSNLNNLVCIHFSPHSSPSRHDTNTYSQHVPNGLLPTHIQNTHSHNIYRTGLCVCVCGSAAGVTVRSKNAIEQNGHDLQQTMNKYRVQNLEYSGGATNVFVIWTFSLCLLTAQVMACTCVCVASGVRAPWAMDGTFGVLHTN